MPVMTQAEKASYATNVGVYTNTLTGELTSGNWTTITWNATPRAETNNNPTSQATSSRFNVGIGLWRLRLNVKVNDNGVGNTNTRFAVRFRDAGDTVLTDSLNAIYITGTFGGGASFNLDTNYLVRFTVADTVQAQVLVNDVNWLVPVSTYIFGLEKVAES